MNYRNSHVNVPLFSSRGLFKAEFINGVTTVSLHHFPILSSTVEADDNERPGMNSNRVSVVPARSLFPISRQREPISNSRGGGSFYQQNEVNLEEFLNYERELIRRGLHFTHQYPQHISLQGTAFTEIQNQVLQPKTRKRSRQMLQLESSKKLKQDSSKSPDSRFPERSGWCSLCEIDCITGGVLKEHILGKKHKRIVKKLKKRDIIGNLEENEKQVKEVGIRQKKRKRSPNTNQQTVECKTCDKVFNSLDCFESHVAGKKHVKQLKKMKNSKASSKVNDDNKKCAVADGRKMISTMSGLPAKRAKNKHVRRATDDSDSDARSEKFNMKENAELKEQQQMKGAGMPSKEHKMSTNLSKFSKKTCKICNISVYRQADFESHVAGRKHAKMLQISNFSKFLLKSEGNNSKECANADGKESVSSDNGLVVKDNLEKTVEDILEFTGDGDFRANSDEDVRRENADIKEIDHENVDVPDGKDNRLELEVRNDKENTETDYFDSEEDTNFDSEEDKNDINEFANTDLKESEVSDYGPLVKDDVDETAEGKTGSGANNEEDDLKESAELKSVDRENTAKPEGKDDTHDEEED